jgi:predicted AAA+ superfamily ATPase
MIRRDLYQDLKEHISKKEITFIAGPRQAGKTTLMLMLRDELLKEGKKVLYLNLDIEMDKQFFGTQLDLIKKIELEIGKQGYVFIDEIQRKNDAGFFLKGIYDQKLPYKFIISGSGSVELKEKVHESLAGRKRIFELSTISFKEFLNYKTGYKYDEKIIDFFKLEKGKTLKFLEEYISFGGYPRVVLDETFKEKNSTINEIFQSYLEKDIYYLFKVQKSEIFINLIRILASQIGKLVNYSELSNTIGINILTLKNYIWYLEKTFILKRVSPFYKNIRKEITKSPIFYFYDLGMRNFALNVFGKSDSILDKGFLFQNFIFNILTERVKETSATINFWRTQDKAEVDFVLNYGNKYIPIEVKYSLSKKAVVPRSLLSFIKKYKPGQAFIINLEKNDILKIGNTEIIFMPFYDLYSNLYLS